MMIFGICVVILNCIKPLLKGTTAIKCIVVQTYCSTLQSRTHSHKK